MTTNQTIDGVPRRVCHACVTYPRDAYCPVCDPTAQGKPVALYIEAAAQKLADCMDYPWKFMSVAGRSSMREHAKAVIDAALGSAEQPAPVALVLPARVAADHLNEMAQGWNSCIDEVIRLNK